MYKPTNHNKSFTLQDKTIQVKQKQPINNSTNSSRQHQPNIMITRPSNAMTITIELWTCNTQNQELPYIQQTKSWQPASNMQSKTLLQVHEPNNANTYNQVSNSASNKSIPSNSAMSATFLHAICNQQTLQPTQHKPCKVS